MRSQEQDGPTRTITLRGQIGSDGSIALGDGRVTCTKGATGAYTLNILSSVFRAIRNIALTPNGIGFAQGVAPNAQTVNIGVYGAGGAGQNTAFHYTISGIAL